MEGEIKGRIKGGKEGWRKGGGDNKCSVDESQNEREGRVRRDKGRMEGRGSKKKEENTV